MTGTEVTPLPRSAICAIILASIPALVLSIELRQERPDHLLVAILVTLIVLPLVRFSTLEGRAR
ncbi:hypothetical protein AYO47_00470 [Planctomyces sp. SCGC AG-212-M04]|nr:hypothetical protein AYO47_00470 [Planctomyces sp. SCGC AG-212-M04]